MGYRNYLAKLSKKEYNKIKKYNKKQWYKYNNTPLDDWVGVYKIGKPIVELGKYVNSFDEKLFNPVFLNEKLQKNYEDNSELYIVGKRFLEILIDRYAENIRSNYSNMINIFYKDGKCISDFYNSKKYDWIDNKCTFDFSKITDEEQTALYNCINHLLDMGREWGICSYPNQSNRNPYILKKDSLIISSWKYEYAIFELVRIYNSFNWKKCVMIYYGY
jgi:Ni,Fe-hydrogenase I large subunit